MKRYVYIAALISGLSGCSSVPRDAFLLSESSVEDRKLQSRNFPIEHGTSLLEIGAEILRNMGYKTNIVDSDLGLVTATKVEDDGGIGTTLMTVFSAGLASPGKKIVNVTFIATPSRTKSGAVVTRITFQRMTMNADGEAMGIEPLNDKETYYRFYDRLSESLFLDPDNI